LAHDVPAEAFRRFRADLNAARERKQQLRAEGLKTFDEKKQVVAAWIAEHGAKDQQARQAVGMLPMDEAVEAMADDAFRALADRPRYVRDGADRLQAFLRQFPQHHDAVVNGLDLVIRRNMAKRPALSGRCMKSSYVRMAGVTLRCAKFRGNSISRRQS
jgi:hypothetical protein